MVSKRPAGGVLYRKYRSRDFDELIGQTHVTQSLENALKLQRLSHAYLFTGPRGVGKTSAARILARRLNNLTIDQAMGHMDIIEIDAASNRRIDEIRDLREKVHAAPTSAQYKVYIVDEVHMLTTEAFNALLKTLEEPPSHVVFILATTDPSKLPDTITSRTQRFNFRLVELPVMTNYLQQVAQAESIKIDSEAISLIAQTSGGSVRDGLSLLDQVANLSTDKQISGQVVSDFLGLAPTATVTKLLEQMAAGQLADGVDLLEQLQTQSVALERLIDQMIRLGQQILRHQISHKSLTDDSHSQLATKFSDRQITDLIKRLANLVADPKLDWLKLEVELVDFSLGLNLKTEPPTPPKIVSQVKTKPADTKPPAATKLTAAAAAVDFDEAGWLKALTSIKPQHNSLYALLRLATPHYLPDADELEVGFKFQFHKRRLEEGSHRRVLESALEKVYGRPIVVKPTLVKTGSKASAQESDEAVESVLDILGGEVVNQPESETSYTTNRTKS